MPSVQIRNISEKAYTILKDKAKADRRSIQQEATWILETVLAPIVKLHEPDWTMVDQIREEMTRQYGVLPDSTPLIREMRDER